MSHTKFAYNQHLGSGLLVVEGPYIGAIAGHYIIDMVKRGLGELISPQEIILNGGIKREVRFSKDNKIFLVSIDLKAHPQIVCSAWGNVRGESNEMNLGGYNIPDFTGPANAILSKLGVHGIDKIYELAMSF